MNESHPVTLAEIEMPRRLLAAGDEAIFLVKEFFGWSGQDAVKDPNDFTPQALLDRGWTHEKLIDLAEGYEWAVRITPENPPRCPVPYNCGRFREYSKARHEMKDRSYSIKNSNHDQLIICVEPEAHEVLLEPDEEVIVHDPYLKHPAMIAVSKSLAGDTIISVWPGDGKVRVEKNGVDLLTLLPECIKT